MTPPTTIICTRTGKEEANAGDGANNLFTSTRSTRSVESISGMMRIMPSPDIMLVIDTDGDGDQILAAEDERNSIFRTQQQHDVESAAAAAACGSSSLPPSAQSSDSKQTPRSNSGNKYPGIPLNGSFDTADTEECSQASTDDGEVHLAGGQGDGFEDDEEQGQGATTAASSPLGAKDLILQKLRMARDKLNDMLNWCECTWICFECSIQLKNSIALYCVICCAVPFVLKFLSFSI